MKRDNLHYGVIGNCQSAAVISKDAKVEWLCLPNFTAPSAFASLLDENRGGHFSIQPKKEFIVEQEYEPKTPILKTTFTTTDNKASFQVIDFMPRYVHISRGYHHPPEIIRIVKPLFGTPEIVIDYNPALNYAEFETTVEGHSAFIKAYPSKGKYDSIYLYSNVTNNPELLKKCVTLDEELFFICSYNQKLKVPTLEQAYLEYYRTKTYWLDWVERREWPVKYTSDVVRSAITIKLLTYQTSGAIIAAVTTSMPETIGEERNWDYRYCWIRDASMIISVLTKLGDNSSAERFLNYILHNIPNKDEKIQIMYGISGETDLTEISLPWLEGYEGSKPVRIGNAAYEQKQNDIYGVLLDVILKNFNYFSLNIDRGEHLWSLVRNIARIVEKNWEDPDMGIWEFRAQKQHFIFSKVLCWVAMDRAAKIAKLLGQTEYMLKWQQCANTIQEDVNTHGWNESVGAFTQSYENKAMDAANLLMCDYGFIEPSDPHYISTVRKIKKELCVNGMMFRYKNVDDFGQPKSSFTICTFWLIKALYRIGEKEEAVELYENLLKYSNHLGLFSEDMDFETRRLLGNFPQGYSHLALIDVAWEMSENKASKEDTYIHHLVTTQMEEK